MIFVVIWVICGVFGYMIADSRGGSGLMGALLGFMLGPIGVLCTFFMSGEQAKAGQQIESGAKKKCPRCAELVQPDALVCRHCGGEFEATTETTAKPAPLSGAAAAANDVDASTILAVSAVMGATLIGIMTMLIWASST